MNYYYLSETHHSATNQNELFLLVVLGILIGYIIYHAMKCKSRVYRRHINQLEENFMDTDQHNELMNGINNANSVASYGYANPHLTSCGY
jgi:hypothetical protein